ncbi:MAG: hypothetical protein ABIQ43_06230 [Sphingomonas sp.]
MAPTIAPAESADRYAEGQIWEYKTRLQDTRSLLKIQRIEDGGTRGKIYHISIVGIVIGGNATVLTHSPVSRAALDASVTRLSDAKLDWPDPTEGIAEWRAAKGGVFTIPVAEIADITEKGMMQQRSAGNERT